MSRSLVIGLIAAAFSLHGAAALSNVEFKIVTASTVKQTKMNLAQFARSLCENFATLRTQGHLRHRFPALSLEIRFAKRQTRQAWLKLNDLPNDGVPYIRLMSLHCWSS